MDIKNCLRNSFKQDCFRCQNNTAYFHCSECHNGFFCLECDRHVHSLSTKKSHKRRSINDSRIGDKTPYAIGSLSTLRATSPSQIHPPIAYQRSSSMVDMMSSIELKKRSTPHTIINDIDRINEDEKEELLSTIKILKQTLSNTSSNLNETIHNLYSQIEELKQRHIDEIDANLHRQSVHFDHILLEKEDRINFLYEKVYQLEEISGKQKNKIEEYQERLENSQSNYRDKIALANCHLDELMNENKTIKEYYEKRIGEITNISAEEKNKIENTYQKSIETLKVGYESNKVKHLEIIQQKEKEIKEMSEKHQKEKSELSASLEKLKETNDKHLREKVELIKTNNTLKKSVEDASEMILNLKTSAKERLKEERLLNEEVEKMKAENESLVSKSEKLNNMLFGRFKRKK